MPLISTTTKVEDLPEYLTIREVAAKIGVSYTTIRNHILQGRIPFREFGGRQMVPRTFFEEYAVSFEEKFVKKVILKIEKIPNGSAA